MRDPLTTMASCLWRFNECLRDAFADQHSEKRTERRFSGPLECGFVSHRCGAETTLFSFMTRDTVLKLVDFPNPNFQSVCGKNLARMLMQNMIALMWE